MATAVVAAILFLWAGHASAEMNVQHPAYWRALGELRGAREDLGAALNEQGQASDVQQVIEQIDRAIQDVQDTLDGEVGEVEGRAAPAMAAEGTERFRRALQQLDRAHDDIELRQQDSYWKGYKANSAQDHIEAAKQAIRRAIHLVRD